LRFKGPGVACARVFGHDGFECALFTRQQLPPHRVATASDGATEAFPQSCCMHEGLTGQYVQGYPAHNQQGFHRALCIVLLLSPRGLLFLMGEVPLYRAHSACLPLRDMLLHNCHTVEHDSFIISPLASRN